MRTQVSPRMLTHIPLPLTHPLLTLSSTSRLPTRSRSPTLPVLRLVLNPEKLCVSACVCFARVAQERELRNRARQQATVALSTHFLAKRSYSTPNLSRMYLVSRGTTKKLTYAQKVSGERKLPAAIQRHSLTTFVSIPHTAFHGYKLTTTRPPHACNEPIRPEDARQQVASAGHEEHVAAHQVMRESSGNLQAESSTSGVESEQPRRAV